MRTTLDLPDPVFRELKARAALRGMKMKDLLNEMITNGLQVRDISPTVFSRSQLPVARHASGKYRIPARSNAEIQHILDEEDTRRHAKH